MTPRITAVVPVFNRVHLVQPALASIMRAADRHGGVEVVIIDNGSTDGAESVVDSYADLAIVVRARGPIAALRNVGARSGAARYLSFLDSDVIVGDDYFVRLDELFVSGVAEALGCETHLPEEPCWSERVWHDLTVREDSGYREYINSGNFAITRAAFEEVGGFPENFETGEDSELCRRLRILGHRIYQSQTLAVRHLGNPKTVSGFYRRLRWHALQTRDGNGSILLATRVALANIALVSTSLALAAVPSGVAWSIRAAAVLGATLLLPSAIYAFRVRQVGRAVNPFAAFILVEVMLAARVAAFVATTRRERAKTSFRSAKATRPAPAASAIAKKNKGL